MVKIVQRERKRGQKENKSWAPQEKRFLQTRRGGSKGWVTRQTKKERAKQPSLDETTRKRQTQKRKQCRQANSP